MAKEFIMNEFSKLNRLHKGIGSWSGFYVPGNAPGFESVGDAENIKNEIPVPLARIRFFNYKEGEKLTVWVPGRQLEQHKHEPPGVRPQQCGQREHRSKQQLWVPVCPVRPLGELG